MSKTTDEIKAKDPVTVKKYNTGDKVIAGYQKHKMIVIDAQPCVKGWRYQLGFTKKDGTVNRRKNYLFFFDDNLKANPE